MQATKTQVLVTQPPSTEEARSAHGAVRQPYVSAWDRLDALESSRGIPGGRPDELRGWQTTLIWNSRWIPWS